MSKLKKIPKFKNEKEEAEFWATHDTGKKDMPYQSLMKVFLDEKAKQELKTI